MQKTVKKLLLFLVIAVISAAIFYYLWLEPRYTAAILMYHKIGDEAQDELLNVRQNSFIRQMAYIKWRGYNVISLDELVEAVKNGEKLKHNTVVITFDDGYEDNYKNAYAILKSYNFPATIFLISGYIDKDGFLKQQQIEEMLKSSKITFGAHTRNNAYLPDIKDKNRLEEEISGPKTDIESRIKQKIDYFCYPSGGFTDEIKEIVKEAGYKGACTTNRGFARLNKDVYELKRIKVKDSDFTENPLSFWLKLSGYYNIFRKGKTPY